MELRAAVTAWERACASIVTACGATSAATQSPRQHVCPVEGASAGGAGLASSACPAWQTAQSDGPADMAHPHRNRPRARVSGCEAFLEVLCFRSCPRLHRVGPEHGGACCLVHSRGGALVCGSCRTKVGIVRAQNHVMHPRDARDLRVAYPFVRRAYLVRSRAASAENGGLAAVQPNARRTQHQQKEREHHTQEVDDPSRRETNIVREDEISEIRPWPEREKAVDDRVVGKFPDTSRCLASNRLGGSRLRRALAHFHLIKHSRVGCFVASLSDLRPFAEHSPFDNAGFPPGHMA